MLKRRLSKSRKILRALLKEKRVNADLNQVDVATRLGVPQSFVSKYESGERLLDMIEVKIICSALNINFVSFATKLESLLKDES